MWENFLPSWENLNLSVCNLLHGFSYIITYLLSVSWFTLCRSNVRFLSHLTSFKLLNSVFGAKIAGLKLQECISSSDKKVAPVLCWLRSVLLKKKKESEFSSKVLLGNGIASSRLALGSFHPVIQWETESFFHRG